MAEFPRYDPKEIEQMQRELEEGASAYVELRDKNEKLLEENEKLRRKLREVWNPKWGKRNQYRYDPAQMGKGIAIEREHTNSGALAAEIAMDHLDEFPNYYDFLEMMERMLRKRKSIYEIHELLAQKFGYDGADEIFRIFGIL